MSLLFCRPDGSFEFAPELDQEVRLTRVERPRVVPVRNLYADEDAHDDDQEVERDGEPVLVVHVLGEAAQDHNRFS